MLNGVWSNQGGLAGTVRNTTSSNTGWQSHSQSKNSCPNSSVGYRTAKGQRIGNEHVTTMTIIAVTASTSAKLASSRLQVSTSETLGRGLSVIQDIPAGSLLFRTNPLISVLDDSLLDKACSTCFSVSKTVDGSVGKDLFKCTGCSLVHYCSKVPHPISLLMADMSAERLEGPSFKRVQVFAIEQEHSTGST